jgi:hypothetical protein
MPGLTDSEARLLEEVSSQSLMADSTALAKWERISGTPGEREGVDFIRQRLEAHGVATTTYEFDSLLGWPEEAGLELLGSAPRSIKALTHALTPSTAPKGLEGELVYAGAGEEADYAGRDVAGKIALTEGMPSPTKVLAAQTRGAVALIGIGQRLHDLCVSPVWGTPTTRTAGYLPKIPVITILQPDGAPLKAQVEKGPTRVRLRSKTFWGWRKTLLLTGDIPGAAEPDRFVLFSGHHCSWYYGAMDNGTANATMLEVARILSKRRSELRRSVRFAFWPGHTQGRYSGSTWYFDNFWEDLHDRCVLHINADSPGARGANIYHALSMPEVRDFAVAAIKDGTGMEAGTGRIPRAGDQSFWGCGIPAMFMDLSQVPQELAANPGGSLFTAAGEKPVHQEGGLPWWWHTPDDTIDKIDPDVLRRDAKVYLLSTWRAGTAPILPLRLGATASEIRATLEGYQRDGGGRLDLSGLIARAKQVEEATGELDRLLDRARARGAGGSVADAANRGMMAIGRALVPAHFSGAERFEQDLALPIPAVASVAGVRRLRTLDPASDEAHFLTTELTRGRNRVAFYLSQALAEAKGTIAAIGPALAG